MSDVCGRCGREGKYPTEAAAQLAIDRYKISHGIWTGYQVHDDGTASLLHEPESHEGRRDRMPASR